MDAEQIKTLLDMRMAKYPDHACLMQELTFKDEKIAALESENARLEEALRGCLNSLCEYVDVDSPGKMSDRKGRGQKAAARACEVLGDA